MNRKMLPKPDFWAKAGQEKKTRFSIFLEMMIFVLVFFVAEMLQGIIMSVPLVGYALTKQPSEFFVLTESGAVDLLATAVNFYDNLPDWAIAVMLISSVAMIAAAIIYCVKIEKRGVRTMGLCGKKPFAEYMLGLAVGLVMFLAVVGIGCAAGGFRVSGFSLSANAVPLLLLFALGFVIHGAGEELMVRGYLATSLGAIYPVSFALLASSVMFATLHTGNNGFNFLSGLNIFLIGLVLCVYMIKRGNIWGACAIHTMWNFAQGCIFNFPVSGIALGNAMFEVKTEPYRSLLTGGDFGPEASICCTIVLLAALGIILALRSKDPALEFEADDLEGLDH